ncbi:hypothetical protein VTO42DRAFT_144 [Malbranchea cinnamomea]
MTAAAFGEKLLAEVQQESLADILCDVRNSVLEAFDGQDESSCLGIKPIDELLQLFRVATASRPQGGQQQTGQPAASEEQVPVHDGQEGYAPPERSRALERVPTGPRDPIIEITSPSSGDGKTSLLYYITAIGVLPPSLDGVHLGGKGGTVVFLDTDFRFDAERLRDVLVRIVRDRMYAQDTTTQQEDQEANTQIKQALELTVGECLRHVHVFRPQSSLALLATIRSLESYLLAGDHVSHARKVHAIVLDSASAFYWQDRREAELLSIPGVREERKVGGSTASVSTSESEIMTMSQVSQETISSLRHLQRIFCCAIVYTTWGLQRASHPRPYYSGQDPSAHSIPDSLSFRPYLPRPWPTFPTLRLVVQRDAVRPFAPLMSIDEAERDAPSRQGVVARGEFSAWVDMWGSENWAPGVAERVAGKGTFGFWVRSDGVGGFTDWSAS